MRQLRPLRVGRPFIGQPGKTGHSPPFARQVLVVAVLAALQPGPLSLRQGRVWISPPHRDTSPRPAKRALIASRIPPGLPGRIWTGRRRVPDPPPAARAPAMVALHLVWQPQPLIFMTRRPPFPFIVVVGNPRGPLELAPPPLGPLEFVEG